MAYTDRPRFYYPTAPDPQLALPGVSIKKQRRICGDGHIVMRYHGGETILCGATIPGIKKKYGGGEYHASRVPGTGVCKRCQKVFRELPDGEFQKFIQEGHGPVFVPPADRMLEVPIDTRYDHLKQEETQS